jgi:integrase
VASETRPVVQVCVSLRCERDDMATATATKKAGKGNDEFATDKGYFVRSVGYRMTGSGNKRAATFYLGKIDDGVKAARLRAAELDLLWQRERAAGHAVWSYDPTTVLTPAATQTADGMPEASSPRSGAASPVADRPSKPLTLTVSSAREAYLRKLRDNAMTAEQRQAGETSGVTPGHVVTEGYRLARVVEALGAGLPLSALDRDKVLSAILFFSRRPVCKPNPKAKEQKGSGKRISMATAKAQLKTLRAFLRFCYQSQQWQQPQDIDDLFRRNPPATTAAEMKEETKRKNGDASAVKSRFFSLADLCSLYAQASGKHRTFVLLGLNCGFANMELATLRSYEVRFSKGKPATVGRFRLKTQAGGRQGVWAEWSLWAETAAALQQYGKFDRTDHLVLTTHDDKPLIDATASGRRDAVRAAWEWVYRMRRDAHRVKVDFLPFKHLRKTAANWIRNDLGFGKEIADAFLSHSDGRSDSGSSNGGNSQIAAYTDPYWVKVAEATAALHTFLQPMFEAAATVDASRGKEA